jgi:hypothetical protein
MTGQFIPATESELFAGLEGGLLAESHHQDLKRELGDGKEPNRRLAKDLAAFSIDGGLIFIGVDEGGEGRAATLHAVRLAGLKERIDQVARSIPKPPIGVRIVQIPAASSPDEGYLVVIVPPSPEAPHMVDGRYWGRSDTTNYALSDSEVAQLHQGRTSAADRVADLLRAEVERDPANAQELMREAHLFVVAQPVLVEPELLLRSVPNNNLRSWVGSKIVRGIPGKRTDYSPNIGGMASQLSPRAHGYAAHTYCVTPERMIQSNGAHAANESDLLDVEIGEDGGIRLFCGRATHERDGQRLFIAALVEGHVASVLDAAVEVANASGYLGSWDFGVAISNLRGAVDHVAAFEMTRTAWPFSEDEYAASTRATWAELDSAPEAILDRLLGRLQRAFGLAP